MKKFLSIIIFSAMIFFSASDAVAQISLETIYPGSASIYPVIKYFNHTSPKWMAGDNNFIYLYNLNHSLYRQITIYGGPVATFYLTEDLFDTDSTNMEYLIHTLPNAIKIYREDGTLLFSRDSSTILAAAMSADYDFRTNIMVTDSGTKMRLYVQNGAGPHFEIYSLPGTLPCPMTCGGVPAPQTFAQNLNEHNQKSLNNPYPNPSSSQTHIPYQLPQGEAAGEIVFYDLTGAEVKRYNVDRTFSDLVLSGADLSAGSYYYQLLSPHSKSEGRKLIVIK